MQTFSPTRWSVLAAGAVAVLAALAPQPGHAFRVTAQAVAVCQGAIRKRPLAVQNEGTTNAFVTCALNNTGNNAGTTFKQDDARRMMDLQSWRSSPCAGEAGTGFSYGV